MFNNFVHNTSYFFFNQDLKRVWKVSQGHRHPHILPVMCSVINPTETSPKMGLFPHNSIQKCPQITHIQWLINHNNSIETMECVCPSHTRAFWASEIACGLRLSHVVYCRTSTRQTVAKYRHIHEESFWTYRQCTRVQTPNTLWFLHTNMPQ